MKTNIGIETTDEERQRIAEALGLKHKLATRHDIKTFVEGCIKSLIQGEETFAVTIDAAKGTVEVEPPPERDRSVRPFVPSRGDEPYLYKPKDPELAARCRPPLRDRAP
jgi:hypothetical protein